MVSQCSQSSQAMEWLLCVLKNFDPTITKEKILYLQLEPSNADCMLECIFLLAETLNFIFTKRQAGKQIDLANMISNIKGKLDIMKLSKKHGSHGTNLLTMMESTDVPPAGILPGASLA